MDNVGLIPIIGNGILVEKFFKIFRTFRITTNWTTYALAPQALNPNYAVFGCLSWHGTSEAIVRSCGLAFTKKPSSAVGTGNC